MQPANPTTRVSLILRLNNPDDADSWDEFVAIYQPLIWRLAKRMGMNDVDASDACQNTLLRLTQVVQQWSPDAHNATFRGWLYRVARNSMLRQFEREKKIAEKNVQGSRLMPHAEPTAMDSYQQYETEYEKEFQRQVFLIVARKTRQEFKPMYWQAFWLTYVKNRQIKEVAELLEVSVSAIYVARSRVLKRVREESLRISNLGFRELKELVNGDENSELLANSDSNVQTKAEENHL